jgi:hypothetical protein
MALAALDPEGLYAFKTTRRHPLFQRMWSAAIARMTHAKYAARHRPKASCRS